MAQTSHTLTTCVTVGTDGEADYAEYDVTVSYTVAWGAPERGPSYSHGGLPADPDEITHLRIVKIDGKPVSTSGNRALASDLEDRIWDSDRLIEHLFTQASEQAAADLEAAMERGWEERAEWMGLGR